MKLSLAAFKKKYSGLYKQIIKRDDLSYLLNLFDKSSKKHIKWTPETLKIEALKYNRRSEFSSNSGSAYVIANQLGILNDICSHMPNLGKYPKNYWTLDKIDELIEIGSSYKSRSEWVKDDKASYNFAFKMDLVDSIIPLKRGYLSLEECKADAKKYKTKGEWDTNSKYISGIASNNGWRKECTAHMPKVHQPNKNYFTLKQCKADAKKYKTKGDWSKNSPSSFGFAVKRGWYEKCCKHMTRKKAQDTSKITFQYSSKLKFIKQWKYVSEIERKLNLCNIGNAAKYNTHKPKIYKLRGGFIFSYKKIK